LTLFEYLGIAYSLVLSLAAVRAASVLPHSFSRDRRYWVHTAWVLADLTVCLLIFWNFWSYREIDWTFGKFALVLALPTSLFVSIAILCPDEPAQITSWREYYYSIRVKFFASAIAYSMVVLVVSTVVLGMPLLHPFRLGQLGALGAATAGAVSDRPSLHASLAGLTLVAFALLGLLFLNEPGALHEIR
jgi:hypothetical protein